MKMIISSVFLIVSLIGANPTDAGCETKCGDVTIPFPFGIGIGSRCSINPRFDILCNTTFRPPKPFIPSTDLEITNISDSHVSIRNRAASTCNNAASSVETSLAATPLSFSSVNKLITAGCDKLGSARGSDGRNFTTSCASACNATAEDVTDFCPASIPTGGSKTVVVNVESTRINNVSSCGYAFLGEPESFHFRSSELNDPSFPNRISDHVSLVLDWAIGTQNCSEARKSNNLSCTFASDCVDSDSGAGGYRCQCEKGYQRNPYVFFGCQDIDECEVFSPCAEHAQCFNSLGSYSCFCRVGYLGDGKKDGQGCSKNPKEPLFNLGPSIIFTSKETIALALIVIIVAIVFPPASIYFCFKRRQLRKKRRKNFERNGGLLLEQHTEIFTAEELEKATDNYSEDAGILRAGRRHVAIKKLRIMDESQIEQFINEVVVLTQVVHPNVTKLLGCCLENEVPMLVYEFVSTGHLFHHIHNSREMPWFSWDNQLRIAVEAAEGLACLHTYGVIHGDVKSTNIFLDENDTAKVSEFGGLGLLRLHDQVTSPEYLDPEYLQSSWLTDKSDVYSFGVVLAELMTGRFPAGEDDDQRSLATVFSALFGESCLLQILEPRLLLEESFDQIQGLAGLIARCLELKGENRPSMNVVAVELERLRNHPWNQENGITGTVGMINDRSDSDDDQSVSSDGGELRSDSDMQYPTQTPGR